MAEKRKDSKTMERAATAYGKLNRVDLEDEQAIPLDQIIVQPFTATDDPRVLGIEPIPNIAEKISSMIEKYRRETIDIEDVEFEDVDLEFDKLFPESSKSQEISDTIQWKQNRKTNYKCNYPRDCFLLASVIDILLYWVHNGDKNKTDYKYSIPLHIIGFFLIRRKFTQIITDEQKKSTLTSRNASRSLSVLTPLSLSQDDAPAKRIA